MIELLTDPWTIWTLLFFAVVFGADFVIDRLKRTTGGMIDNAALIQLLREEK